MDLATLGALCALGSAVAWAFTSLLVRSLTPRFGTVAINATRVLGLGRAMTLSMRYPVVAAVLAAFLLDERISAQIAATPLALVGAGVAVAGVVVLKL